MRQPKPFFRKFTKSWYVQIRGKQINLGRDKKQAWARYSQLMASPDELDAHTTTVHGLFDLYLSWVQKNRSAATYDAARRYLSSFARTLPKSLVVSKLAPSYITTWMSDHATWGDTTRNDAISHVQRAFHWAVNQRLLTRYPLPKLEDKPSRKRREVVYSPAEFQAILNAIPDREFRDLLEFLWETGCRPIEARILEATHVDIAKKIAILP
ncbi:MAG: tyrosine-type recombinase/integrase, partial [Planctomycetales bacterium]